VTKYTVIRAIATAPNFWTSAVAQAGYSITPQAPTPVISPASGACSAGQMITITDSDAHATIRYTVDGSTPNPHSTLYTHPFPMTCNETVEAIAIDCNVAASAVAIATY
jgi:hypothetical protein